MNGLAEEFQIPIAFTLLAFFTFGITGALAGLRRGYDYVGVLALATIAACGGGLIRDGLLISTGPPAIVTDERYLLVILAGALLTTFLHRYVHRLNKLIAVVDALGLGAFAVQGVQRCLDAGLGIPAAILGGTITAVGGGLLRDILVREEPLLFRPGQFYALVAIGGCCLFLLLTKGAGRSPKEAALVTIVLVSVVRLLAIRFNWQTSPVYVEPPKSPFP